MSAPASIHGFLGEARVPYTVVPHQTAFTAQEEAAAMHGTRSRFQRGHA